MARARYAEGSLYKTKDGRWRGSLQRKDGTRQYLSGRTRADVVRLLNEAKALAREGKGLPTGKITVAGYLAGWLEDTAKPRMRTSTYKSTESRVRLHLVPAFGKLRLSELTTPAVKRVLNAKLAAGLSPKTVKHLRDTLRAALNDAVASRPPLIPYNPAEAATPPRIEKRHVAPLTTGEAKQLLAAVQSHRLAALFTVGLACGLRSGEVRGLQWSDVGLDAEHPVMRVRQQLQQVDGCWQLVEPKTEQSRRTIPLPAVAVAALREHRKRQLQERLKAGSEWQESVPDLVFTSPIGRPVLAQNLSRTFGALLAKAGLPERRFHDLRHACCSLLLAQGVPPGTVMEILGHSNLQTTMMIYREVTQAAMREGVKALDFLAG